MMAERYPGHDHEGPCGGRWAAVGGWPVRTAPSPACQAQLKAENEAAGEGSDRGPGSGS